MPAGICIVCMPVSMNWCCLVTAMRKMQLPIVMATTTMATLFALNVREALVADVVATEVAAMVEAAMAVVTEAIQEEEEVEVEVEEEEEDTEVVMIEDLVVQETVVGSRADDLITEYQ